MSSPFISTNQGSSKITINGVTSATGNIDIPLTSLTDVSIDALSDGQVLRYDNFTFKWKNATLNLVTSLNGLLDCSVSEPSALQVLQYNGATWQNSTLNLITALSSLSDCFISNPSDKQVLQYDSLNSIWTNQTISLLLSSLEDCTITTPSDKQVLQYDNATSKWKNETLNLVTALSSLSDCTISNPVSDQLLKYDGSKWINSTVSTSSSPFLTMSADTVTCFDLTTVNANSKGFKNGVFDGRYVYLSPFMNGQITRYDTTLSFSNTASYSVFNTGSLTSNQIYYQGAIFDGRYIYFIPWNTGSGGILVRYDTTLSFTDSNSYVVFNMTTVNANSKGFFGGIFDGKYLYCVPQNNFIFTRYDTTASFTSAGSYSAFDLQTFNSSSKGFNDTVFDGRYIYMVPNHNGSYYGQITRYDTTLSFTDAGSYAVFNTTAVNANSKAFVGAVFDGRYVYFVPCSTSQVTRYDTTLSFTDAGSYAFFEMTTINANCKGFSEGVYDGRYVYYIPVQNPSYYGIVTRYDTTLPFTSVDSYTRYDISLVNAGGKSFHGAVYDGKYIYLAPFYNGSYHGIFTRILANQTINTNVNTVKPQLSLQYSINDVLITAPSANHILQYNGIKWINTKSNTQYLTMDSTTVKCFDVSPFNAGLKGYFGAVFDGKYIYYVPSTGAYPGTVVRYNPLFRFDNFNAYTIFDTITVQVNSYGFQGAVYDGRYIYFVPGQSTSGQITRYDTRLSFTETASYSVYNTANVNANSKGFMGGVFDGRYIYLVPFYNGAYSGQITRYDTTQSFITAGSYAVFNTTAINVNSKGFIGAVFDGRYIYYVPYNNGVPFGQITRYDTTGPFTTNESYTFFNTASVNANSKGFNGGVFDGRYIYFVPLGNGAQFGQITRYDTTLSFTDAGSYAFFDTTTVNANSKGFQDGVFDGRYIYFVPWYNTTYSGQITRYDTTLSFADAGSYSVFDSTSINAKSKGFQGAVYDGKYVYLANVSNTCFTRLLGCQNMNTTVNV